MAKLVDSGNNQYGIKGSFTWVAATHDSDFFEEFPFTSNVWSYITAGRTSGTGTVDVTLDFFLNGQWVELAVISAAAGNGSIFNRFNLMSGNPLTFDEPLPARLNFATSSYIGTISYELRW